MLFTKQRSTVLQILGTLLCLLRSGSATSIPNPFIFYNDTLPIGTSGYVSWDLHAFAGPVNLWIQQNYPNATLARVSISFNNVDGHMLWEVGNNVPPGEYYFELQITSGTGIIYKSDIWSVICATCPISSSSTAAATSSSSSTSHSSYPTTYTSSTAVATPASSTTSTGSTPTVVAAPAKSGISSGAAAGIGVGAAGAVGIIAILIWLFSRSQRRRRERKHPITYAPPWVAPPPHHIGDSPEMKTYSSASPYTPSSHNREWSHELQTPGFVHGAPHGDPNLAGTPTHRVQSPTNSPHMSQSSPPHSPHLAQSQIGGPSHYNQPPPPPPQSNQPWTHSGAEGHPFPSYEGLRVINHEGSENLQPAHGLAESQQGLFPRRPVGS